MTIRRKNRSKTFGLAKVQRRSVKKPTVRTSRRTANQTKILVGIDLSAAPLHEVIGHVKQSFAALEALVEEIKRKQTRALSVRRRMGKSK